MTRYLSGGLKPLVSYQGREHPLEVYKETKQMVDLSFYLPQEKSAGIYHHVVDYPSGKVTGGGGYFYSDSIDFGQGPTVCVSHVAILTKVAGCREAPHHRQQAALFQPLHSIALQMFLLYP